MRYLLDTSICIYLIKKKPLTVLQKFETQTVGEIGVSTITVAELQFGVHKSQYPTQNQRALEQFLIPLAIVEFDYLAAVAYGRIRAILEQQGTPIGSLDLLIAAQALSLDTTLVTNNLREFSRVPNLKLVNWAND
ncbi:MAG TPA: type II toxin-antitoxin system VapC family toxin [Anaerolineae bacterium]|nr:type II toxin-antitoxin system VapC family toxin [Anaerolineae bacterium]